jgi:hypothetical protein
LRKVFTSTILVLFCLQAQPAMAYLDPATGSSILSAILGAIAAIAFTARTFWYKIQSIFSGSTDKRASKSDQEQENKK